MTKSYEPTVGGVLEIPKTHHIDKAASALREGGGGGTPDDLLSTKQLATWLGMSTQWLEIGRHKGYGPRWRKLSPKRVRYARQDVLDWLDERVHRRTSEYTSPKRGR